MAGSLRLAEFAVAISLASDLGLGHPLEMVLSTCLLSLRLGELTGLGDDELRQIYYLALFRHAGCTADSPTAARLFGDDLAVSPGFLTEVDPAKPWTMFGFIWRNVLADRSLVQRLAALPGVVPSFIEAVRAHCEVAQQFVGRIGLDETLQHNLRVCNEAWNGRGVPGALKGEAIPRVVRLYQVAEEAVHLYHFVGPAAVVPTIRAHGGATLDPELAGRFCESAEHLIDRARIGSPDARSAVLASEPGSPALLTEDQIDAGAAAFGDFADLKAPFLAGHSRAVADLVAEAARRFGLPESDRPLIRRAGLLHDIGRVGISSGIWCKAGALTEAEWDRVRLAPYYTARILAQPEPLTAIGAIAAAAFERLDGSGYHRNLPATALTAAMRLLAAAGAYRSMSEPRPYRPALPAEQAAGHLRHEVRAGRLDGDAVNAVLAVAGHRTPEIRRDRLAGLTEREIEVLRLVARGLPNRMIADQLVVTPKTIGNHLQNIFSKIDVTTRAAASYYAMQHGLV